MDIDTRTFEEVVVVVDAVAAVVVVETAAVADAVADAVDESSAALLCFFPGVGMGPCRKTQFNWESRGYYKRSRN